MSNQREPGGRALASQCQSRYGWLRIHTVSGGRRPNWKPWGDSGTAELGCGPALESTRRALRGRGDHGAKFWMGCKSSVNNCPPSIAPNATALSFLDMIVNDFPGSYQAPRPSLVDAHEIDQ